LVIQYGHVNERPSLTLFLTDFAIIQITKEIIHERIHQL
jgi:hypothetical protein